MAGGKLVLTEGGFNISAVLTLVDNIEVCGQGWATRLVPVSALARVLYGTSIAEISIHDLEIDNDSQDVSASLEINYSTDIYVERLYVHDVANAAASGYGMYFFDGDRVHVYDNHVVNIDTRDGIQFKGCRNSWMARNYVENTTLYGIDDHDSTTPRTSERNSIVENVVYDCTHGINASGSHDLIQGNIIDTTAATAGGIHIREAAPKFVRVIGNSIYNAGDGMSHTTVRQHMRA